eukprot:g27333.t1
MWVQCSSVDLTGWFNAEVCTQTVVDGSLKSAQCTASACIMISGVSQEPGTPTLHSVSPPTVIHGYPSHHALLCQVFPQHSPHLLETVLERCHGDVVLAIESVVSPRQCQRDVMVQPPNSARALQQEHSAPYWYPNPHITSLHFTNQV